MIAAATESPSSNNPTPRMSVSDNAPPALPLPARPPPPTLPLIEMPAGAEHHTRPNERMDDVVASEDGLIFSPYNPQNIEITLNDVQSILAAYGVPPTVHNFQLYRRAFVHRSYLKRPQHENDAQNIRVGECPENCLPLSTKSNERLEFLGDGVLECVVKYYLYRRFPKAAEGFMTEKKIEVVKNETIGRIAYEMGLHRWLIISRHAEEKKLRTNLKKVGCLFEAFLGAMFLDFNKTVVEDANGWFASTFVTGPGFQMTQKFLENVLERHIDWADLIHTNNNFKNLLQVRIQKEFKTTPQYLELGYDAVNGYRVAVYLCVGQSIHTVSPTDAVDIGVLPSPTLESMRAYLDASATGTAFIRLAESSHKIKRKAEQMACQSVLEGMDGERA
jgi:dsRNA-specific ribonuclease